MKPHLITAACVVTLLCLPSVSAANTGLWNWTTSSNPHATTWSNISKAGWSDDVRSTGGAGAQLNLSGWNTSGIPIDSTIDGIELSIELRASSNTGTNELFFRLGNGTHWSAVNTTGDRSTTEATLSYGGSSVLWGLTFSNISRLQVNFTSGATSTRTMQIDNARINITYTVPVSNPCSLACNSFTTEALSCDSLNLTGTGFFNIIHEVSYSELNRQEGCFLAINTNTGRLITT
jgi:hypothetical protein